jgi:hypothetical protein
MNNLLCSVWQKYLQDCRRIVVSLCQDKTNDFEFLAHNMYSDIANLKTTTTTLKREKKDGVIAFS